MGLWRGATNLSSSMFFPPFLGSHSMRATAGVEGVLSGQKPYPVAGQQFRYTLGCNDARARFPAGYRYIVRPAPNVIPLVEVEPFQKLPNMIRGLPPRHSPPPKQTSSLKLNPFAFR